ncbi:unnamed protein product [Adineta steineri]|uniref:Uncharacterized protein n=1 Tax=Adineta steineri TaxID=433720 RepID=A0A814EDA5_9BILA|nr:unnamed protein product [Adineta steineri]
MSKGSPSRSQKPSYGFSNNPTLLASSAALHHLLGSMDNKNKNNRAARFQFEESLKLFLSFTLEDNQILSATYNNIGNQLDEAIGCAEKYVLHDHPKVKEKTKWFLQLYE